LVSDVNKLEGIKGSPGFGFSELDSVRVGFSYKLELFGKEISKSLVNVSGFICIELNKRVCFFVVLGQDSIGKSKQME